MVIYSQRSIILSRTLPANMTRGTPFTNVEGWRICRLCFHSGDIAQVRINEGGHHLGRSGTPHYYRGHSAATAGVMQWAKESSELAATAAHDGLNLII
jgi:hypothetical protein